MPHCVGCMAGRFQGVQEDVNPMPVHSLCAQRDGFLLEADVCSNMNCSTHFIAPSKSIGPSLCFCSNGRTPSLSSHCRALYSSLTIFLPQICYCFLSRYFSVSIFFPLALIPSPGVSIFSLQQKAATNYVQLSGHVECVNPLSLSGGRMGLQ